MSKQKNNHKDRFIQMHGVEMWKLMDGYVNRGDRSPEATEANKFYQQISQGYLDHHYTVYAIYDANDVLLYLGKTSTTLGSRWNCHKYKARSGRSNYPIHMHMRHMTTDTKTFPEFTIKTLHTFSKNADASAKEVELIDKHKPPFNVYRGGGSHPTLKQS